MSMDGGFQCIVQCIECTGMGGAVIVFTQDPFGFSFEGQICLALIPQSALVRTLFTHAVNRKTVDP